MIGRIVSAGFTLLVLAGCTDSSEPAPPAEFTLVTTDQWSGGAVELHAANFDAHAAPPLVFAGLDTAVVVRVDASTFTVTLPPGPSGAVALTAKANGVSYDLGQVQRYGLASRGDIGTTLQAHLLAALLPGGPTLLGVPPAKYNLRTVNLRTGQVLEYDSLFPPFWGATLSDQPGLFALVDSSLHGGLWQLGGQNQATLVVPFDTSRTFFGYQSEFAVTRISDSVWLGCGGGNHTLISMVGQPPATNYNADEACGRLLVYRSGAQWSLASNRLIDATTGDLTHDFGDRLGVASASADGMLLYAVHPGTVEADSLLVINPVTFATVASAALPAGYRALTLEADPSGDRIYALMTAPDSSLAVGVFNPGTLARTGLLPLGERCPAAIVCGDAAIAVDQALGRIDIVGPSSFTADPAPVSPRWRMDRLP